jgi:hypothetical protein
VASLTHPSPLPQRPYLFPSDLHSNRSKEPHVQADQARPRPAAGLAALALGGAAISAAASDDEPRGERDQPEAPVTGSGAEAARRAALDVTSGGTANSVERDSENGATWEVEVTKRDGSTVDVRLDERYKLVLVEGDDEGADTSR